MGSSLSHCMPGLGHTRRGAGVGGVGTRAARAAAQLDTPGLGLDLGFWVIISSSHPLLAEL